MPRARLYNVAAAGPAARDTAAVLRIWHYRLFWNLDWLLMGIKLGVVFKIELDMKGRKERFIHELMVV